MTRLLQFSISGSHHNSNCWREFEQIAANGICVCCNFLKFPPENLNCGVTLSTENCSKQPVCCNYLERVLTPCPAYLFSLKYLGLKRPLPPPSCFRFCASATRRRRPRSSPGSSPSSERSSQRGRRMRTRSRTESSSAGMCIIIYSVAHPLVHSILLNVLGDNPPSGGPIL